MLAYQLLLGLFLFHFVRADPTPCTYSCPETNTIGQSLLKRPLAIPSESVYSIFECVYGEVAISPKPYLSCFYNKADGKHALGKQEDKCPLQAVPCSEGTNHFSSPGKPEVPAWIENGRYLLYLKENHT